jgi:hypothetical protein
MAGIISGISDKWDTKLAFGHEKTRQATHAVAGINTLEMDKWVKGLVQAPVKHLESVADT